MTYQEKNIIVSFCSQVLVLGFFLVRILALARGGELESEGVFRLWLTVILLEVGVTIVATILTHVLSAIFQSVHNGGEEPQLDSVEDERDALIGLKGSRVAYIVFSIGVFLAMLTLVFEQPALVMFSALIPAGLAAQIAADGWKLYLYRRGF